MRIVENGVETPEYIAQKARIEALKAERGETKPFEVGKSYRTVSGGTVTCIELSGECARFNDGTLRWYATGGWRDRSGELVPVKWRTATTGWRYNRNSIDRGRCTGTSFDHSDPRCVIPEKAA
jgi:hypothetical protein